MTRAHALSRTGVAALLILAGCGGVRAQSADPCAVDDDESAEVRRRPGVGQESTAILPCDPHRMPSPDPGRWPEPKGVVDRWRLNEALGRPVNLLDPYSADNPLKGDRPSFGKDVFLNLSAASNSLLEDRLVTRAAGEAFLSQTISLDAVLYEGDTVFRPPDWLWRFTPVINFSETRSGSGDSSNGVAAIQALYYERHLRDLGAHYDFDSVRAGIQPLISDFRGFLLSDQPLAVRLFGTRENNTLQYNLALLARLPKDGVRLNDVSLAIPNDQILFGNLYWQDLGMAGSTSEFVFALNRHAGSSPRLPLDDTAAEAALRTPRSYEVAYGGYGFDGHVGRLNATAMLYGVAGRESRTIAEDRSAGILATFGAAELSMDFDWRRLRASVLHASGDPNPHDRNDRGFDALTPGAIFAGTDSSFFLHQRLGLAGAGPAVGGFDLKSRDGLLPSLRPAGNSIEADFTNPGLNLLGVGLDLSLSPQLTLSLDANELWFDKTATLEALLHDAPIPSRIGAEFVANVLWRPFASQNVILRLSGARLVPGPAYRALYGDSRPFSVFALLILNY